VLVKVVKIVIWNASMIVSTLDHEVGFALGFRRKRNRMKE